MSDDERVLRSFVADDEELLGLWDVTQVKRSKGHLPPAPVGEETVAVTEDRFLWFQSELEEVHIADLEDAESEYIEQQAAPAVVMGGGVLFVLGLFVSIGAFVGGVGDTVLVAMPALTGLAVFLGTRVFANVTDREGETREGHRLRLWTADGPVSIWTHDGATMGELEDAVAVAATNEPESPAVEDIEDPTEDQSVPDDEGTDDEGAEPDGAEPAGERSDASDAGDPAG